MASTVVGLSHEALIVSCAAEALEVAHGTGFDAALIELKLPDMSGIELLRRLSTLEPQASYWLMSSPASASYAAALAREAHAVIQKPIDRPRVRQLLRGLGTAPLSRAHRMAELGGICVTFQGVLIDETVVHYVRHRMRERLEGMDSFVHVLLSLDAASATCSARVRGCDMRGKFSVSARATSSLCAVAAALDSLEHATCALATHEPS